MASGFMKFLSRTPIIGGLFDSPEVQEHQQALAEAAQAYSAYRPEAAQGRLNALRNTLGAYKGAENLLASWYGPGVLPRPIIENPLSPRAMQIGASYPQTTGGGWESVAGGATSGAVTAAPFAASAGPYAPLVVAGGAVLGGIGGAFDKSVAARPVDYGPYKPYVTGRSR